MECLEKIIGLTPKECNCLTGTPPVGYNESISGFFIDDMEDSIPLIIPQTTKDCGENSIWTLLERAKKEGIRDFLSDFQKFFSANNQTNYPAFSGRLGELASNQKQKQTDINLGIIFTPKAIQGLKMTLRGFRTRSMQSNETVSRVSITNDRNDTVHTINQDVSFSTKAKTTHLDKPLILPLIDKSGSPIRYTFTYDRFYDEEIIPANSQCDCNCSRTRGFERFGELRGTYSNNLAFDSLSSRTVHNYGLQPVVEITCEGYDFLCAPMNDAESDHIFQDLSSSGSNLYQSHPYFVTVAKLVQLYSIQKLISSVLRSNQINKFTILHDKKDLYKRRSSNQKKIEGHMIWLAENTPGEFVDCYSCRSTQRIRKTTLRL